jgi:hypothetical protein
MTRIAIIDHATHQLNIEDISDEDLEKYGGDEEEYIKSNYTFDGEWSWDYIVGINFYAEEDKDGIDIEPTDLL